MKKTFQEFAQDLLTRFVKNGRIVIAVDGFGGSGKSTFAEKMSEYMPNIGRVCIDHFYQPISPEGENEFHWERFEKEVIDRLKNGEEICYAPYDWKEKKFHDEIFIEKDQSVIIEGVYVSQEKYREVYDAIIWISTPDQMRLERGIKRDGEVVRAMWENVWLPYTQKYMNEHRPDEAADIIIDGAESDFNANEIIIREITSNKPLFNE